jgi:membrane protease YdiL (CAAX protease family)
VGCKYEVAIIGVWAVVLGLFGFNILSERMDLANWMEEIFLGMSKNVIGILAIGVFGPICEEVVFRGGIMRPLLKKGLNPWAAIIVSALIFGLAHGNPAQIPFAFAMGLFLGWLYYRTGSVMPGIVCHILNNGIAIVSIATSDSDETLIETLGTTNFVIAMIVSTVAFAVLTFWLNRHFDNHPEITIEENIVPNEE